MRSHPELRPVKPKSLRLQVLADLLASLPRLSSDEIADFEADLTAIRCETGPFMPRDPWES
jgi:hypothetical protein